MSALASVNRVSEFCDIVIGFVDSLPLLKKIFPGQSSYKQENLVSNLLAATYGAHNALEDVRSLGWLIKHEKVTDKHLQDFTFSPEAVKNQLAYNREKNKNIESLHPLIAAGVMKMTTAQNIAGSGLCLAHLHKIHSRDGEDGLRNIFVSKNSHGQARVTCCKKTLNTVIPSLCEFFVKQNSS